jgi:hypothetical protein
VYHFKEISHEFDFDSTQILALEKNDFRTKLIEGVYMQQNPTNFAKSTKLGPSSFVNRKICLHQTLSEENSL